MQTLLRLPKARTRAAGVVFAAVPKEDATRSLLWHALSASDRKIVRGMLAAAGKRAYGTVADSFLADGKRRVFLAAMGEPRQWTIHRFQPLVRKVIARATALGVSSLAVDVDAWALPGVTSDQTLARFVENVRLAQYRFTLSPEKKKEQKPLKLLELFTATLPQAHTRALRAAQIVGDALDACRNLANMPGGDLTPARLADEIRTLAHGTGVSVTVLDKARIAKLGMGGLLGVARGSAEEPRFIILAYRGPTAGVAQKEKPFVFVGKGITFDSGGLNVKPGDHMSDMHLDMSGAAAVAAAIIAAARLRLPLPVVGLIPAAENMPSGSGYRPGDVLRTLSGKTIEIVNTDAEGRVVLADALAYAARFRPRLVVDVATLTGTATVALGSWIIGLLTSEPKLHAPLQDIGEASGDYVWPMPLWEEYKEHIQGTVGDVLNASRRRGEAGMITAASFLEEFAKGYPWAHLDIASTMVSSEGQHLARGATGTGVRFLIELLSRAAAGTFPS